MAWRTRYLCEFTSLIASITVLGMSFRLKTQLEDLFVDEKHRAKGLGKRLFGELGKLAKEKNCGRVEWRVLKVSLPAQLEQLQSFQSACEYT